MARLAEYERRMRRGRRLFFAIGLVCAAVLVGGLVAGEPWIAMCSFGVFVLTWLIVPLIFDRCPNCGRYAAEHARDPDSFEPFHCIRCGARLRPSPYGERNAEDASLVDSPKGKGSH